MLGHFRFQQAAANAGYLGDQLGGTFFQRFQGFELAIDPVFLFAEGVSLGGNGRRHLCVLGEGHWPQYVELRLQLRLPGQQRCGQAINILDEYLHLILCAFQLGVITGQGNLLLEAVQLVLQPQQIVVGDADDRGGGGGGKGIGHGRRQQPVRACRQKREGDADH